MKNPMNPMFDSEEKYDVFRATVKIWITSLITLDGTDFNANKDTIVGHPIYLKRALNLFVESQRERD